MKETAIDKAGFFIIKSHLTEFDILLSDTLSKLNIDVTATQHRQILLYLDKLLFWNKAYNLTAIKQPKDALVKHVFDCLSIIPHLRQGSLLDIGTGAGLPGVIIAICEPERQVTVLDSNQKKIRFIKQSVSELGINNLTPIAKRIEHFEIASGEGFDVVTSRAFASLHDFVMAAETKVKSDGYLQAMKGVAPNSDEIANLNKHWSIKSIPLTVPMLPDARHLVELSKKLS